MRKAFIRTLTELAGKDSRISLMTADLGYMVVEEFGEKHPDRFFNVGVAEQNMVGLSTGMAGTSQMIPFLYSMSSFVTMRPYEFIRNGPLLHNLKVRIIGIGGGFEYGAAGHTHYGVEDLGIMRIQPGMTVVVPADFNQARSALLETFDLPGPIYYRIGKDDKTTVLGLEGRFQFGKPDTLREGKDIVLLAMGPVVNVCLEAAESLAKQGMECSVVLISTLNPLPSDSLVPVLKPFKKVLTVETHYVTGALGSLVAEVIAENNLSCHLKRFGVKEVTRGAVGSREYMNRQSGLSADIIAEETAKFFIN
ncbi:MAG: 1-deoxy-D-xylulose-5-phosphate synthase [Nitrospina sp.]|jgi:transketolase|nr:1-deoxy-D-xylulose-5-phosphate synthase [Nitrospina sp.]